VVVKTAILLLNSHSAFATKPAPTKPWGKLSAPEVRLGNRDRKGIGE